MPTQSNIDQFYNNDFILNHNLAHIITLRIDLGTYLLADTVNIGGRQYLSNGTVAAFKNAGTNFSHIIIQEDEMARTYIVPADTQNKISEHLATEPVGLIWCPGGYLLPKTLPNADAGVVTLPVVISGIINAKFLPNPTLTMLKYLDRFTFVFHD